MDVQAVILLQCSIFDASERRVQGELVCGDHPALWHRRRELSRPSEPPETSDAGPAEVRRFGHVSYGAETGT